MKIRSQIIEGETLLHSSSMNGVDVSIATGIPTLNPNDSLQKNFFFWFSKFFVFLFFFCGPIGSYSRSRIYNVTDFL